MNYGLLGAIIAFALIMYFSKEASAFDDIILAKAAKYKLDPFLMKAIIKAESNFNPRATNIEPGDRVSLGLAQILWPTTAQALGFRGTKEDLYNADTNLELMSLLLLDIQKRYSSLKDIIASYNAGRPKYQDGKLINQEYVDRVLKYYYQFKMGGF